MIPTLAIDPGHDGAAVLLDPDGRTALWAWAWQRVVRQDRDAWVLRDIDRLLGPLEVPNLHRVGAHIGDWLRDELRADEVPTGVRRGAPYTLVVEGLFGHGPTLERLSWYAGLVAGPLLSGADGEVLRPMASEWRTAVLGIPANTRAQAASHAALRLVPRLVRGLGVLAGDEHVCEAAAIARWAWVRQRERAA